MSVLSTNALKLSKTFIFYWIFLATTLFSLGQSREDLKKIRVDELSDAQIEEMVRKAQERGYSQEDVLILATSEGVPAFEISKLRERMAALNEQKANSEQSDQSTTKIPPTKRDQIVARDLWVAVSKDDVNLEPFGYSFFKNLKEFSFEPNSSVPIPDDYVLGPGDKLEINVYGASERNYSATVSKHGKILLTNIGSISVAGSSVTVASRKIRAALSSVYQDLRSTVPSTFVQVSIVGIRSVNVSIIGEVKVPGTYTVNGLSSVLNALYAAGGPLTTGTLRDIRIFRNNKRIASLDLYQFLLEGKTDANIRLQDNDVIQVDVYKERVTIKGEVKRPAIYELVGQETIEDLIQYAGGFTPEAHVSTLSLDRISLEGRSVADIYEEQFGIFEVKGGDEISVGRIEARYTNRVILKGSVARPGSYAWREGMMLNQLVEKAGGMEGDAFLDRILITRTQENFETRLIAVDYRSYLSGQIDDLPLQKDDVIQVSSIYDLKEERLVRISGEVNQQGAYRFSEGMTVEDLILQAGGLKSSASAGTIEISRRPAEQTRTEQVEVINLNVDTDLQLDESSFNLSPFDLVVVRRDPNYFEQRTVEVVGQVAFEGVYSLKKEGERISDLLQRAGGLTEDAYPRGAVLIRKTEFFQQESESEERKNDLIDLLLSLDPAYQVEADKVLRQNIEQELELEELNTSNSMIAATAKKERLLELASRNTFLSDLKIKETEAIPLNINKIMSAVGSPADLVLQQGDIISIPKEPSTVRLRGRVLYPNTVSYQPLKGTKYYINQGGGFETRANRSRTYVVYANGSVARTKSLWFLRKYPKVEPGAEVIVPVKPLKVPVKIGEIATVTTSLAAIASIIISQVTGG